MRTLQSVNGQPGGSFGAALAALDDVTGDGVADLAVGAPGEWWHDRPAGRAYVHDGATGRLVYALRSPEPTYGGAFGIALAAVGDVDHDGTPDLAVGAPLDGDGGQAYVFSGATGAVVLTAPGGPDDRAFGHALAPAGDADGDGAADVLVGDYKWADEAPDAGAVYVVSGATGAVLQTLLPPAPEPDLHFGRALAGGRDLTGDGVPDWAVAARHETVGGLAAGRVYVFNGADGTLALSVASPAPSADGQFGLALALCPDLDGDGSADLAVGAGRETNGLAESGGAYLFSGATGALLQAFRSPNPAASGWFGQNVACVDDTDGDGQADLAVGAAGESHGAGRSGTVYVMSTATGQAVAQQVSPSPTPGGKFGVWMAALPGEQAGSVAVGAPAEDAPEPGAGAVHIAVAVAGSVGAAPDPAADAIRLGPPSPNPTGRHVSAMLTLDAPAAVEAVVVDAQGRTVLRRSLGELGAGSHWVSVGTARLAVGRYTLHVRGGGSAESRPFTVAR